MPEFTLPEIKGGVCYSDLPYKIKDNQSPDMLNMWYNDKVLNKRWGQIESVTNLNGFVHAIYEDTFNGFGIVHAGTNMYQWDIANSTANSLTNAIANSRGSFFPYEENLYYLDGAKYWTINSGFAVTEVTPYVPIVYTGCTPNLSTSTVYQDYNIIGGGFETWYTADGTNLYTLPGTGTLAATNVTAKVNGTDKAEGTDFTVDRTNRIVTWGTGPTNDSVINGVRIVAYDTLNSTIANQIKKCTIAIPFGGESSGLSGGTRIIASGNPDFPTTYWKSGLKDPTYFPDTQDEKLDNNNQSIVAFGKQYGDLIAFKTRSIYGIQYLFDGTNVTYPTRELNAYVGCDIPQSIQLIDNRLVFFNSYKGGFILDRTDQTDEKNVKPISHNIGGAAFASTLTIEQAKECTSIDFGRKYWLGLPDGRVYVWDYDISPYYDVGDYSESQKKLSWFPFDNMYAKSWYSDGQTLYYGKSGTIVKLENSFADFGAILSCYWQSKAFDFGLHQYYKTVYEVIMGLRTDTNTSVTIEYLDEKNTKIDSKTITVGSFSWINFSWDLFTWIFYPYAKQIRRKPKRKKIVYYSIKLSNNELSRDLGITDLTIIYDRNGRIK